MQRHMDGCDEGVCFELSDIHMQRRLSINTRDRCVTLYSENDSQGVSLLVRPGTYPCEINKTFVSFRFCAQV